MAKVKVPQFRSTRSVTVESDATNGATVGVNLFNQDGSLFDPGAPPAAPDQSGSSGASGSQAQPQNPSQGQGQGQDLTTDDIYEGRANLYYTDERVRAVLGRTIVGFAFGDAPRTIYAVPDNRLAYLVRLVIDTPFNGTGAAVSVGTMADANALMPAAANDPATAASYEFASNAELVQGDAVRLVITPGAGATQGAGRIILDAYQR